MSNPSLARLADWDPEVQYIALEKVKVNVIGHIVMKSSDRKE